MDSRVAQCVAGVLLCAAVLAGPAAAADPPGRQLAQLSDADRRDLAHWTRIKDSRDVEEFRAYLRAFPNGNFAPLARNREAELARGQAGAAGPYDGEWRGSILGCYSKQETVATAVVRGGQIYASWLNVVQIKEEAEGSIDAAGRMRATGVNGLVLTGQASGDRLAGTYTANSLPLLGPCAATFELKRVSMQASAPAAQRPADPPARSSFDRDDAERQRQAAVERERAEIERKRLELERERLEFERQRQQVAARAVEVEQMDREMVATSNANVRERPDATSATVGGLKRGERVGVTGKVREDNWYRVTLPGRRQGFVFGDLLGEAPAASAAAIPAPAAAPAPAPAAAAVVPPSVAAPAPAPLSGDQLQLALMRREPRTALVIGNAAYRQLGPLRNPINDARAMAERLRRLSFDVTLREDATRDQMIEAIDEFGTKLRQGGVGAYFFAGHGLQVRGENFMIPVDAAPRNEVAVAGAAVGAAYVLDYFALAGNRFNLMILDACRNNPLQGTFRTAMRGLALIGRAPGGTMIAFATAPDSVAQDGDGANGLFTSEILAHIDTPGLKIEDLFKRVTTGVRQRSQGDQVPWVTGSLEGDFYFRLPPAN